MSHSALLLKSGFPRGGLNGLGRYMCQLKRVTIKFCKAHGDSQGVRQFIETELVGFARSHPGVVVYVKPRRHRGPSLAAEFLSGQVERVSLHRLSKEEVFKWLSLLVSQSGRQVDRYRKLWHTDHPSVQGPWGPTTFRDPSLNLTSFPLKEYWGPKHLPPSATELLIQMFNKEQRESGQPSSAQHQLTKQ